MKRETLLRIALEYLKTAVPDVGEAELRGYLRTWRMVPYLVCGKLAGCAMVRGNEIHALLKPEYRGAGLRREALHKFLSGLVAVHGGLVTRVAVDDFVRQRFVTRIGFTETHRNDTYIFYSLTESRFGRK